MNYYLKIVLSFLVFSLSSCAVKPSFPIVVEHSCGLLYNQQNVDGPQYMKTDNFRMLDYNDEVEFKGFQVPAGLNVTGVVCDRTSAIPSKYDYVVLDYGYPLTINSKKRMAVLELVGAKYTYRVIDGSEFSTEEKKLIAERLDYYHSRTN